MDAELIGVPVRAPTFENAHSLLHARSESERPVFYCGHFSTTGGGLSGYDPNAGEAFMVPVPSKGIYGLTAHPNGKLYLGGVGPGDLYEFDPLTRQVRAIPASGLGVSYIWQCAVGPDGMVYGAGYPDSHLVIYDPATGEVRSEKELSPGDNYVRSIVVDDRGLVWCGIGSRAKFLVYDPAKRSTHNVLPEKYGGLSSVGRLLKAGDEIYATVFISGDLLVFSQSSEELVRVIRAPEEEIALASEAADSSGTLYCTGWASKSLYRVRPGETEPELVAPSVGKTLCIREDRLLEGINDTDYICFDLTEGQVVERRRLRAAEDGMRIQTLASGPDGCVYGSTYINMHFFRFDPERSRLEDLGRAIHQSGQIDSMRSGRDGRIYFGAYALAWVGRIDPAQPFVLGENPHVFGIIGKGQYRTRDVVQGPDGRLYIGSIPDYNSGPIGAFTVLDPETGSRTVYTDLFAGGAADKVEADDRWVYAAGAKRLLVFDPQRDEVVKSMDLSVSAMCFLKGVGLAVSSGGRLLVLAAGSLQRLTEVELPDGDLGRMVPYRDGASGDKTLVIGINDSCVLAIRPDTSEMHCLCRPGGSLLALDGRGGICFARHAELWRIKSIAF